MKTSSAKTPPVLKQFAGLWTMQQQPSAAKEWSLEEKFKQAKKAGFDAVGSGAMPEVVPLCQKYALDYVCYINADKKTYADALKAAQAVKPARVNVQMCDHDTLPADALKVWLKLEDLAAKLGLNIDLEVHRDTCTETPEKVDEIAALYRKATGKKIRFCWDYSHLAIVKHIYPPYAARLITSPDLLQLARQIHFRPFNGHHCQVPATDGKGHETPEIKPYLEFVEAVFTTWLKAAKGGEVLYACPEFGPISSGYGLSCFPNVWKDAIYLRAQIDAIWKKSLAQWKK